MFATRNSSSLSDFSIDTRRNRVIWFSLAFQAGWINAGGFLACHRFVSHVTGFATQFGVDIAEFRWTDATGMLTVPLFFLMGSMISAFFVDRKISHGQKGQFHILFFLMSLFLFLVTIFGSLGYFGRFGAPHDILTDYLLIALLCLSSGIQNAAVSTSSNNFVRTTHLTGITTDLGVGVVRVFSQSNPATQKIETHKNQIRMLLVAAFTIGSAFSAITFLKISYIGFAIPTAISFSLFIFALKGAQTHA